MNIMFYGVGKEEKKLIERVFDIAYTFLGQKGCLACEVSFVGKERIRKINAETRGVVKATDVLSFQYLEGIKGKAVADCVAPDLGDIFIGEIMICKSLALKQAEEYGHSAQREVAFLALHGLLHLFGYDHEDEKDRMEMEDLQRQILMKAEVKR